MKMALIYYNIFLIFTLLSGVVAVEMKYNDLVDNMNLFKAITRSRRGTNDHFEYTDNGIIIRGGNDLPSNFKGSGSSDFAFDGESFRHLIRSPNVQRENQNIDINNVIPTITEKSIKRLSPYPNSCQHKCHQYITSEYNPVCGSDGVTYFNRGKFNCALKCGRQITGRPYVSCGFGSVTV